MRLSDIGEEALIERLARKFLLPSSAPGLVVGIGDDAAVLDTGSTSGLLTIVTTDMLVERMDYLPEWITPYQLGWKSIAANISDIAAMGGTPTWGFISVGFRGDTEVRFVEEFYRGMVECAGLFRAYIAGGDTNAVYTDTVISITQLGTVEPERLARRSAAQAGDRVLVTGLLGESRGGLELLLKLGLKGASKISEMLVSAHLKPMPRVNEARAAAQTGGIHAMMDISDGLAADLPKLCKASSVGALVCAANLPVSEELGKAGKHLGIEVTDLATGGGEDYELLITASPADAEAIAHTVQEQTGTSVTDIGEVVEGSVEIEFPDGSRKPLKGGWEHFKT